MPRNILEPESSFLERPTPKDGHCEVWGELALMGDVTIFRLAPYGLAAKYDFLVGPTLEGQTRPSGPVRAISQGFSHARMLSMCFD
jgi:hypothetical protein